MILAHNSRLKQLRAWTRYMLNESTVKRDSAREISLLPNVRYLERTFRSAKFSLRNHYRQWYGTDGHRAWTISNVGSNVVSQPPSQPFSSATPLFLRFSALFSGRSAQKKEGFPCADCTTVRRQLANPLTLAGWTLDSLVKIPCTQSGPIWPKGVDEEKVSSRPLTSHLVADRTDGC